MKENSCLHVDTKTLAIFLNFYQIFKLVQVLVTDINTEDFFWLVVVVCTFMSLLIAMLVPDVMYIIIFAGMQIQNDVTASLNHFMSPQAPSPAIY